MMHQRFATRLASVAHQKRKAHGTQAVSLWWNTAFRHLPQDQFRQVMDELAKLKKG